VQVCVLQQGWKDGITGECQEGVTPSCWLETNHHGTLFRFGKDHPGVSRNKTLMRWVYEEIQVFKNYSADESRVPFGFDARLEHARSPLQLNVDIVNEGARRLPAIFHPDLARLLQTKFLNDFFRENEPGCTGVYDPAQLDAAYFFRGKLAGADQCQVQVVG